MSTNTRSQDFRHVFANAFGLTFGPTEVQILCGIQNKPGTDDATMEQQVGLIMSPAGAKLLATMLITVIENFEKSSGTVVPLDPTKLDGLRKMIDAANAKMQSAKKK